MRLLAGILFLAVALSGNAYGQESSQRYLAEIELHTAEEFHSVLVRAEQLLASGALPIGAPVPVTFVLHGPEVRILLRQNYLDNKATVDLAATLSALGVVRIQACETWMGGAGISADELQPFVAGIAYGPAEITRLQEDEGYLSF